MNKSDETRIRTRLANATFFFLTRQLKTEAKGNKWRKNSMERKQTKSFMVLSEKITTMLGFRECKMSVP